MKSNITDLADEVRRARSDYRDAHLQGEDPLLSTEHFADRIQAVALAAWETAFADIVLAHQSTLVVVGGLGRRQLAPYSDLDLLIIADVFTPAAESAIKSMVRSLWDAGLSVGQNVATPKQLLEQIQNDPTLAASSLSARWIAGPVQPFTAFSDGFERSLDRKGARRLERAILASVGEETAKFNEAAGAIEPNIKRSAGGQRSMQAISWIGRLRCRFNQFANLEEKGFLGPGDAEVLEVARKLFCRLRAELHFHAGKCEDVLTRSEQIRIAEAWGYKGSAQLPVEEFMRDVLLKTTAVQATAEAIFSRPERTRSWARWWSPQRQSPDADAAPPSLQESLETAVRVVEAGEPMPADFVWRLRRTPRAWPSDEDPITSSTAQLFLRMLQTPGTIAGVLRVFHFAGLLGRILPEFERIRCLIQFNAYHRYTVDEHTLRMFAGLEELAKPTRKDPPAVAYRMVARKDLLHLAALLHDLGKGRAGDHSEIGAEIAGEVADRLELPTSDRRILVFLVRHHLLLSRLAFHRDVRDETVLMQLVRAVAREDILHMLYALTAADIAAVSPEAYTPWKADLLHELYRRACQWFGDGSTTGGKAAKRRRRELWAAFPAPDAEQRLATLPDDFVQRLTLDDWANILEAWRRLEADQVAVFSQFRPTQNMIRLTVLARQCVAPGAFHKICGALAAHHLEVTSAAIQTLEDGSVLDVFEVRDVHHFGAPSNERMSRISATVRRVLLGELAVEDALWSMRSSMFVARKRVIPADFTVVEIDNQSSSTCTVVDVFAPDRRGLLFALAQTLYQCGYSVHFAKLATYSDEVVDVFYLRNSDGEKIADEVKLEALRQTLIDAVQRLSADPRSIGF